jgi:hypothetical protein
MKETIGRLELSLAITSMLEQHEAYLGQPEEVRAAQDGWSYDITDDFAYASGRRLTVAEREDLLDWMANQRDYARLCDELGDDWLAHCQAQDNRQLLRGYSPPW